MAGRAGPPARRPATRPAGLGHRPGRIAHLAAAIDIWTFRTRARVLAEALGGPPPLTEHWPLTFDDGRRVAERLLARRGPRPTALVCDDDVLVVGASKAPRRRGAPVPDAMSVTGYDGFALATAVEPELTTVRLPADQVRARGMTALLTALECRCDDSAGLRVRLVVRGFTAQP